MKNVRPATACLCRHLALVIALLCAGSSRAAPPGPVATYGYGESLPAGATMHLGTTRWRFAFNVGSDFGGITFSKDGKRVLLVGDLGLALWDTANGKPLRWSPVNSRIVAAAFGAGDNSIWTAGDHVQELLAGGRLGVRQVLEHREIGTGRLLHRTAIIYPDLGGSSATFSPDGTTLLVAGYRRHVELWDTASGKRRLTLAQTKNIGSMLTWAPSGSRVAFIGGDNRLHVYDTSRGREFPENGATPDWRFRDSRQRCTLAPDGKTLALTTNDGIAILDVTSGKRLHHVQAGWGPLAFSADGKYLAMGGETAIRLWETSSFREVGHCAPHHDRIDALAFSPDNRQIACAQDDTLGLWNVASGQQVNRTPGHSRDIHVLAFSPDGKHLVSGGGDGAAIVWDLATGRPRYRLEGHVWTPVALAFSPDGSVLATGDGMAALGISELEGQIRLWDLRHGQLLRQFIGHLNAVSSLAFSPDGRRLASAGGDARARMWDPATGRRLYQVRGSEGWWLVAFSPDGKRLVTADSTGGLMVRRPDTGAVTRVLHPSAGHYTNEGLACIVVLPDNRTIVSGTMDFSARALIVRWRDMQDGHERRPVTLTGAGFDVRHPVLSPDGRWAATAAPDSKAIQLWDLVAGRLLATLHGHSAGLRTFAFSPDSRTLASGGGDTTVLLWDVPRIRLLAAWLGLSGSEANATAAARILRADASAAVPLIRERLGRVVDQETTYARLIRDLDDRRFKVRKKATDGLLAALPRADLALALALEASPSAEVRRRIKQIQAANQNRIERWITALDGDAGDEAKVELEALGPMTEPALRACLKLPTAMRGFASSTPSITQKGHWRVQQLLDRLQEPDISRHNLSPAGIRRALALLAALGTPAARQALKQLAGGSEDIFVTREARKALGRFEPPRGGHRGPEEKP